MENEQNIETLLPIQEQNGKKAISARMLHDFLESKQHFTDWIKNRINQCYLIENEDFEVFHKFMKNSDGGRPTTEYALSLDAAKEISMVEGNEKGKIARQYFIQCEKKLKSMMIALPKDYPSALRALADKYEENMRLEAENKAKQKQLEEQRPKVQLADAITAKATSVTLGQLAKIICQHNGINLGQNLLFTFMREAKYIIKSGSNRNMPYQKYMDMGLFEITKNPFTDRNGNERIQTQVLVTAKGIQYFTNKVLEARNNKTLVSLIHPEYKYQHKSTSSRKFGAYNYVD